ncbi:MAG: hypothetical protein ACHQXA_08520 [Gemmatimonadales bacterium]|jgi:hypothetical protein
MRLLGLIVLIGLIAIPLVAVLIESPLGRAVARRVGGPEIPAANVADLAKKVELMEGEMDDLHTAVDQLREETQFLQRLIEDAPSRPTLPPRSAD